MFVVVSGPPASGKSYLGRLLAERLGAVVLQTDALRKLMFTQPSYSGRESYAVYAESRRRIERLLKRGETVIFDATNLDESKRRLVYAIADARGAGLVIALAYAPREEIRRRLASRRAGLDPLDESEADWQVYLRLGRPDPVSRPHVVINTTLPLKQAVELIGSRAERR